ncbi:protein of unknown function [Methylorubrum extorquens]|uniref:YubB ferredoxin-like domain-containing protein n=1 Tax=Methylorubrum extorquens TaxID=408 RepID=A0A2N9ANC4_METEX|nr:hypothetical protein ASF36_19075 [Methylobacterium sp. Leaf90]SOR28819.1 protein of unknown function [Methylorubrum extorquens]
MANYTYFRVAMTGPADDLAAFQSRHVRPNDRGDRYIDFQTLIPTAEPCPEVWGSFTIGYEFEIASESPGQVEFTFSVRGGDAAPILREIARRYPDVTAVIACEEEGGSYAATGAMQAGELTYERQPWSEAVWEAVHGETF